MYLHRLLAQVSGVLSAIDGVTMLLDLIPHRKGCMTHCQGKPTARVDCRFAGRSSRSLLLARAAPRRLASLSDEGSSTRGPSRSSTDRRFFGDGPSSDMAAAPLLRSPRCLASLQRPRT